MARGNPCVSSEASWGQMQVPDGTAFSYAACQQYGMMPQSVYGHAWNATGPQASNYNYGCQVQGQMSAYNYAAFPYQQQWGSASSAASSAKSRAPTCADGGGSSSSSGPKKEATSLLEELKAKQAFRDEKKRLQDQIDECGEQDYGRKVLLQYKVNTIDQSLCMLGDMSSTSSTWASSANTPYSKYRTPEPDRADQFGRLCHLVVQFLRSQDRSTAALSDILQDRHVQEEWASLAHARIVEKTAKTEHVFRARPELFEVSRDRREGVTVRLVEDVTSEFPSDGKDGNGTGIEPDKVLAIETYLKKAGGTEQVSRLEILFDVKKQELSRCFTLYEDNKRLYAAPMTSAARQATIASPTGLELELRKLEKMLNRLTSARADISEAMVFCIDHGAQHAAPMAKCMARSLEESDIKSNLAVSRLFLVSDVLYNANCGVKGATHYRTCLQDVLPDTFERLGRNWLQQLLRGRLDWDWARKSVLSVLDCWRKWNVFPPLFVLGLEALLFASIGSLEDNDRDDDSSYSSDASSSSQRRQGGNLRLGKSRAVILQRRISRWTKLSGMSPSRIQFAARLRGLCGSALAAEECRNRLCHYEKYWARKGNIEASDPVDDAEDIDGDPLSEGDEFAEDVPDAPEWRAHKRPKLAERTA